MVELWYIFTELRHHLSIFYKLTLSCLFDNVSFPTVELITIDEVTRASFDQDLEVRLTKRFSIVLLYVNRFYFERYYLLINLLKWHRLNHVAFLPCSISSKSYFEKFVFVIIIKFINKVQKAFQFSKANPWHYITNCKMLHYGTLIITVCTLQRNHVFH